MDEKGGVCWTTEEDWDKMMKNQPPPVPVKENDFGGDEKYVEQSCVLCVLFEAVKSVIKSLIC